MGDRLVRKGLAIGIIVLFVGTNIVSSTDNFIKDIPIDCYPLESVYNSYEKFSHNTTWYMFDGQGFYAWYPNGTYRFKEWDGDGWFSGGTWTNDGRYLCCMYANGTLYDINPETLDAYAIGDGGVSLNGLSYDPVTEKLYSSSSQALYEINMETGEQEYIGDFGSDVYLMIAIAFDADGVLYGWDLGDKLWTIDTETGEATPVGPLGINLNYAQDGDFEQDEDILYLAAYTSPFEGGYLYECDEDTGECTLIGPFGNGLEITGFAISYNWRIADFTWFPAYPAPGETILFDASESYDPDGYIKLYEWDWDNDGIFDENHTSPTATHIYEEVGYYPVTLKITDNDDLTDRKTKTVRIENQPPDPPIITGPKNGKSGTSYDFTFNAVDPDDDQVKYIIDWSDGKTLTTYLHPSGADISASHTWDVNGTFIIKAKSEDEHGLVGPEATFTIFIRKNKSKEINTPFLQFLERHQILFPILQKIIQRLGLQ